MVRRLEILASEEEKFAFIAARMRAAGGDAPLKILEAGCGRWWPFTTIGVPYHLTGVDIDAKALAFRKESRGDLDEAIVGDLQSVNLPDAAFDAIYCNCVLEHVKGADRVLDNFARWLKPGGILFLCVPDTRSVYGFVARFTPHAFHIWYYKRLRGHFLAGQPGHGPYKTYYERSTGHAGLRAFAAKNGLGIEAVHGVRNPPTVQHARLFRAIGMSSLGLLHGDYADLLVVFRKPDSTADSSAVAAAGARSLAPLMT